MQKKNTPNPIIVVSGLPRSGTSMMMQALEAGGIQVVTDNQRLADHNNSKGYYEYQAVKTLAKGNHGCIDNALGRGIKVVSTLLKYLPLDRHYKIIFMRRNLGEVLASQAAMLKNLKGSAAMDNDEGLRVSYQKHLSSISKWLSQQSNMDTLYINYADILSDPASHIEKVISFLNITVDRKSMISCIDSNMRHHDH